MELCLINWKLSYAKLEHNTLIPSFDAGGIPSKNFNSICTFIF